MTNWPAPTTPEVARLVRLIGAEAAFRLLEARGGVALFIPRDAARSQLVDIVGEDAVRKLASTMGGLEYRVPLAREWRIIVHRVLHKRSYREIALTVGCTESAVWRTLNRAGMTNSAQLDLFDDVGVAGATPALSARAV